MRFMLLSVALIIASPALASGKDAEANQTAGANEAAPVAAFEPKEERKICKRFNTSESRLGAKKVCLTAEQWKQRDREEY